MALYCIMWLAFGSCLQELSWVCSSKSLLSRLHQRSRKNWSVSTSSCTIFLLIRTKRGKDSWIVKSVCISPARIRNSKFLCMLLRPNPWSHFFLHEKIVSLFRWVSLGRVVKLQPLLAKGSTLKTAYKSMNAKNNLIRHLSARFARTTEGKPHQPKPRLQFVAQSVYSLSYLKQVITQFWSS